MTGQAEDKGFTLGEAWETLERSLVAIDLGPGDVTDHLMTARMAASLVLEFAPGEVVDMAEASSLPGRAVLSWLAHEAGQMKLASEAQLAALAAEWAARHEGQGLIPGPGQPKA